jgi:hypothetical protein
MYSGVFERLNLIPNGSILGCIELERFSHHFERMTLVCKITAENGGIFPSRLDGTQKHIELSRIKGFDFRLPIEVKFD